jgi:hypothetical protein
MDKDNDTLKLAALEDHGPRADRELDAVSGGVSWYNLPGNEAYAAIAAWTQALRNLGY